ncbi:MAG: hypothetical protein Q8O55_07470 [Dehalococcoidales bacterium]|nr:hypothetical protein [Dehalococcoidales bacterium]
MSNGSYDPKWVVTAGRIGQIIHSVHKVGKHLETHCGDMIDHRDLLIVKPMPDKITCKECRAYLPGLPLL